MKSKATLDLLKTQFRQFTQLPSEPLDKIHGRFTILCALLDEQGFNPSDKVKRETFLRALRNKEWDDLKDKDEMEAEKFSGAPGATRSFLDTYIFLKEMDTKRITRNQNRVTTSSYALTTKEAKDSLTKLAAKHPNVVANFVQSQANGAGGKGGGGKGGKGCSLTMRRAGKVPDRYWPESDRHASFLNSLIVKEGKSKTGFEILKGFRCDTELLKAWGCHAFAYVPKEIRNKFASHTRPCIYMGVAENYAAFNLFDPVDSVFFASDSCGKTLVPHLGIWV